MLISGPYCDDAGSGVDLVGLGMEVAPAAVQLFAVTMATLETPSRAGHGRDPRKVNVCILNNSL